MNPLALPFRLPLLPVTALIKLAEVLEEEAEREWQAAIMRQLEDAEYARATGRASDEETARMEEQAIRQLIESRRRREGS
jgi:gas vesicle protein GvpG